MNNEQYKTKWGALLNIISNRNYSTPQIYKIFYFGYYLFTILIALAVLFKKKLCSSINIISYSICFKWKEI